MNTPPEYNKTRTSLKSILLTGAVAAVCGFGIYKESSNYTHRQTIHNATITKIGINYVSSEDDGYNIPISAEIFLNNYYNCLKLETTNSLTEINSLKEGNKLENVVLQHPLLPYNCDTLISYKIKEEKPKSKWDAEIEYLIKKEN